jgi:hypothetical protein
MNCEESAIGRAVQARAIHHGLIVEDVVVQPSDHCLLVRIIAAYLPKIILVLDERVDQEEAEGAFDEIVERFMDDGIILRPLLH